MAQGKAPSALDRIAVCLGSASSRRQLLRGLVGTATAALAGGAYQEAARAHSAGNYCAGSHEQEFLALINDHRAANGLGRLRMGQNIGAAAQHHSADMADRNYLDHPTQGTGKGPGDRMVEHGYPANTTSWSENIYAGYGDGGDGVDQGSARAAFDWWRNSPSHNPNMLNRNFTVIGIARASNPSARYRNYWTTKFGGAGDAAAAICGVGGSTPPNPGNPGSGTPGGGGGNGGGNGGDGNGGGNGGRGGNGGGKKGRRGKGKRKNGKHRNRRGGKQR